MNRAEYNLNPDELEDKSEVDNQEQDTETERGYGREIEGLEPKPERFSKLEQDRDYDLFQTNHNITANQNLAEFFIFVNPGAGDQIRIVQPPHWRSIDTPGLEAVLHLPGSPDVRFYTANTKGAGYLKPTVKNNGGLNQLDAWVIKDRAGEQESGYKVLGLSGEHEYLKGKVIDKSNFLISKGLRCESYWGLARLKQVYFKGELVPIERLKKKGVILNRKNYVPEEGVRLLKTNTRIEEAYRSDQRRLEIFKTAFEIFNRENKDSNLGFPEINIGDKEQERLYFKEFFRRMGKNSATLLNLGMVHAYLHSSNVTMAAEIADIGSLDHNADIKDKTLKHHYNGVPFLHIKDMRDIAYDLRYLLNAGKRAGLHTGKRQDLADSFVEGFNSIFNNNEVGQQQIDPDFAKKWMLEIIKTVIVERNNLPSLNYSDIEDWGLDIH